MKRKRIENVERKINTLDDVIERVSKYTASAASATSGGSDKKLLRTMAKDVSAIRRALKELRQQVAVAVEDSTQFQVRLLEGVKQQHINIGYTELEKQKLQIHPWKRHLPVNKKKRGKKKNKK